MKVDRWLDVVRGERILRPTGPHSPSRRTGPRPFGLLTVISSVYLR
jgi:hypothetical protein